MIEERFLFWWRWLIVATCLVLLFGLSMVVFPGPTQQLFNYIYLSSPKGAAVFPPLANNYIAFVSAVLGATMIGWATALLYVLFGSFRRKQFEGWKILVVSLVAWFIPDTAFSLWAGYPQNAVLNLIMITMFAVPLVATRKSMKGTPNPYKAL